MTRETDALYSEDGKFMCIPSHAVEVAYMLSNAEDIIARDRLARFEIGELLASYCAGELSPDEVNDAVREWREEIEADRAASPLAAPGGQDGR